MAAPLLRVPRTLNIAFRYCLPSRPPSLTQGTSFLESSQHQYGYNLFHVSIPAPAARSLLFRIPSRNMRCRGTKVLSPSSVPPLRACPGVPSRFSLNIAFCYCLPSCLLPALPASLPAIRGIEVPRYSHHRHGCDGTFGCQVREGATAHGSAIWEATSPTLLPLSPRDPPPSSSCPVHVILQLLSSASSPPTLFFPLLPINTYLACSRATAFFSDFLVPK